MIVENGVFDVNGLAWITSIHGDFRRCVGIHCP